MARTTKTKATPNSYEPVSASEASPRNTRRSTRASSKATNTSASAHSRQNSESLRSTPVPNKMTRNLPERFNPRLSDDVPSYETLVKTRKNGITNLGVKNLSNGGDGGLFSYVHLKAPLPKGLESEIFTPPVPECYFLMKRASDNFVSATGMFKASFPWATRAQEEEERRHIRSTYPNTSKEETAGNLWVHPTDAQILAEEYGMHIWVKALLDPIPVGSSSGRKSVASTPVKAPQTPEDSGSPAPSEKPTRRSTRSVSPSKVASPRKRAIKTPRSRIANTLEIPDLAPPKLNKPAKIEEETKEETETTTTTEVVEKTEDAGKTEEVKTEQTTTEETTTTTTVSDVVVPPTPTKASRKSIKVETEISEETEGDVTVKQTNVKVALPAGMEVPETTEEMIAKAKEMVEAAKKLDEESGSGLRKRKADDLATGDAEATTEDEEDEEAQRAKRTKVQNQLRREKVKTRALIGLSATLVVGALLPYVL